MTNDQMFQTAFVAMQSIMFEMNYNLVAFSTTVFKKLNCINYTKGLYNFDTYSLQHTNNLT